jgi:dCMP deaminase
LWDEYFLHNAGALATRADCERLQVGAVVVRDRRIVGTGYNGAPAGEPGCASCPRRLFTVAPGSSYDTGAGQCVAIHAEANALLYTDRADLVGAALYVTSAVLGSHGWWCQKLRRGFSVRRAGRGLRREILHAGASESGPVGGPFGLTRR